MAPAGAGMPTKKFAGPGRAVRIVDHDVEAGEPQPGRDREHHGGDPAGRLELMQLPEIQGQRRGDAEIDKIGEAVEFGAKPRGAFEQPRHPAVYAVENGGKYDAVDGPFETPSAASRIAVRPAHSASRVMRFGTSVRTGMARKRWRRGGTRLRSNGPKGEWRIGGI